MEARTTVVEPRSRRGRGRGWGRVLGWAVVALASAVVSAQEKGRSAPRLTTPTGAVVRGPHLRAVQVLEQRPAGVAPRVRFEWEQVRGAREYVLVGRWTGIVAWTVQTREIRVTSRSASSWTPSRATLELPLPEGSHSWKLLAVLGPNDKREVGEPSLLSFTVR